MFTLAPDLPHLAEAVSRRVADIDEGTLALVLVGSPVSPDDVVAVRRAATLCDVAVVAAAEGALAPAETGFLERAGAAFGYVVPARGGPCRVTDPDGADLTALTQLVLALMPSAVVVSSVHITLLKAVAALDDTFPNTFTRVVPDTPEHTLGEAQRRLLGSLRVVQGGVSGGERRVAVLEKLLRETLEREGFSTLGRVEFVDSQRFSPVKDTVPEAGFVFVEAMMEGRVLRQSCRWGREQG